MISAIFGCVFGILGILTFGVIFVPLAALCAVIGLAQAIFTRNASAGFVAFLAVVLTVIGFVVSPTLWLATAGITAAAHHTDAPAPPSSFAWRMGQQPPAGVTADKDGMPEGYEMQSGANHNCAAPECLWFVRVKP